MAGEEAEVHPSHHRITYPSPAPARRRGVREAGGEEKTEAGDEEEAGVEDEMQEMRNKILLIIKGARKGKEEREGEK